MASSKRRATNEWMLVDTLVEGLVDPLADTADAGGYDGVVKMGRWGGIGEVMIPVKFSYMSIYLKKWLVKE